MGYRHIDFEERCAIARLRKEGATIREIAATLDRSPPTISREIKRNSVSAGEYKPAAADEKARARRWRDPRLDRNDLLREAVLRRMEWGSSPPQVAGRLALEMVRPVISYESIYRFIAAQARGRRTTTGVTSCRRGRRRGVGARVRAAVPSRSSRAGARCRSGLRRSPGGKSLAIGRRTRCCSA